MARSGLPVCFSDAIQLVHNEPSIGCMVSVLSIALVCKQPTNGSVVQMLLPWKGVTKFLLDLIVFCRRKY